jgi:chemotaxis protein methyltransferase CheR
MHAANFEFLTTMLKQISGLALGPDKSYLLESRLSPVAKKHGFHSVDELADRLRRARLDGLVYDVVEAMTTNESFFFRDVKPFEAFRQKILPDLLRRRATAHSLRIWCAAASTGQEPYSLAMILHEEANQLAGRNYEILATDISKEVLTKATDGIYTQLEVQRGLSIQRLIAHFEKKEPHWQLKPALRSKVQFRSFNLLNDPTTLGRFDVVYCRNVLIYFDQETKSKVLNSIASVMNDDGVLVLGGAETVFGISTRFRAWGDQHGLYCLEPSATPERNRIEMMPRLAMSSAK